MILLIDNYDSFVHNLARYFRQLGCITNVVRNDAATVEEIRQLAPDAIVISPGPCTPEEAGISLEVVKAFSGVIPILGICLGHQAIVQAHGGTIDRAHRPVHGQGSEVSHLGTPMFNGIPSPFIAGRYHSLIAQTARLPELLEITAKLSDGTIMGVRHRQYPVIGLQFHPESILTTCGYRLLGNFLAMAGLEFPTDQISVLQNELGNCSSSYSNFTPLTSSRLSTRGTHDS